MVRQTVAAAERVRGLQADQQTRENAVHLHGSDHADPDPCEHRPQRLPDNQANEILPAGAESSTDA